MDATNWVLVKGKGPNCCHIEQNGYWVMEFLSPGSGTETAEEVAEWVLAKCQEAE